MYVNFDTPETPVATVLIVPGPVPDHAPYSAGPAACAAAGMKKLAVSIEARTSPNVDRLRQPLVETSDPLVREPDFGRPPDNGIRGIFTSRTSGTEGAEWERLGRYGVAGSARVGCAGVCVGYVQATFPRKDVDRCRWCAEAPRAE